MTIKIYPKTSSKSFKLLTGINRDIIPSHVTKIAESVTSMGVIRPVVISKLDFKGIKPGTYVIDGQHLLHALIRLGLDIPTVSISISNQEELVEKIAMLNASSKSWQLMDYVQSWKCIHEDYVILDKYFNTYDIEVRTIVACLNDRPEGADLSKLIKKGQFRVVNEKNGKMWLDSITDILKLTPRMDRWSNRKFVGGLLQVIRSKSYDHTVFHSYIKRNKDKITLVTQDPEQLAQFLEKGIKK